MSACTIVSRCLFLTSVCCRFPYAGPGGKGASGSATSGSGRHRLSIIKTPLYLFIAASVYPRLSPVHLCHHRTQHRRQVPMTTQPGNPGLPAPAPRPSVPAGVLAATPARLRSGPGSGFPGSAARCDPPGWWLSR